MRTRRPVFLACLVVIAVATAVGIASVRASKSRFDRAADDLRAQIEELDRVRAQEQRATQADELRLAAWEREAGQLAREIEGLRSEERDLSPQRLAPSVLTAPPRPKNPWENAGRAAPLATFQTVQWAIHAGDVDMLEKSIVLDQAAQTAAQQFFDSLDPESRAEFRTPQRLVALAMAAKSWSDTTAAQVVSEAIEPDGTKAVRLSMARPRGNPREITMRFQPAADGWRLQVPAKIVTSYRNLLLGPVIDPKTYKVIR